MQKNLIYILRHTIIYENIYFKKLLSGYGLVVEHDLAKVETGVRFPLSAPKGRIRKAS